MQEDLKEYRFIIPIDGLNRGAVDFTSPIKHVAGMRFNHLVAPADVLLSAAPATLPFENLLVSLLPDLPERGDYEIGVYTLTVFAKHARRQWVEVNFSVDGDHDTCYAFAYDFDDPTARSLVAYRLVPLPPPRPFRFVAVSGCRTPTYSTSSVTPHFTVSFRPASHGGLQSSSAVLRFVPLPSMCTVKTGEVSKLDRLTAFLVDAAGAAINATRVDERLPSDYDDPRYIRNPRHPAFSALLDVSVLAHSQELQVPIFH